MKRPPIQPYREYAAVVLMLGAIAVGCTSGELDAPEARAEVTPIAIERVYRFVDEMPLTADGNIPQAAAGIETRTVLVGAAEAGAAEAGGGLRWRHVSRPLLIPENAYFSSGVHCGGESGADASARFSVSLLIEEGSIPLVPIAAFDVDDSGGEWTELRAALAAHAGAVARFEFTAETDGTSGSVPVWGDPRITVASANRKGPGPNVLIISLDTLRPDHLGVYGYDRGTSPNLDAFGAEAIVFEQALSASSWTLPAHASLFTGLSPSEHGAYFMGAPPFRAETLAELAYARGYATAAFTEGGYVDPALGFGQGFSRYTAERIDVDTTVAAARTWLERLGGSPFFLFVHTYEVHAPYDPPAALARRFLPAGSEPDEVIARIEGLEETRALGAGERETVVALYDAEIAHTDAVLGEFFEFVREQGVWEDTLVIVLSDHGEQFWEHGLYGHGVSLYEEEVRIPLIVKPAGRSFVQGRRTELVSLTDVYATVADSAGWTHPARAQSTSFRSALDGAGPHSPRETTFSEVGVRAVYWDPVPALPRLVSIRSSTGKVIGVEDDADSSKFYDLTDDPGERRARSSEAAAIAGLDVAAIERYLDASDGYFYAHGHGEALSEGFTARHAEELEALGYFQ